MEQAKKCGCVAETWYGCIKGHRQDCDGKTRYTDEDGTVVEYTHSCDYEEQAMLNDTNCLLAERDKRIVELEQDLERANARRDDWESAHQAKKEMVAYLEQENERLVQSLPSVSGKDENMVNKALGEVYRLRTERPDGGYSEIGVVEVQQASRELLLAYGEINSLRAEVARLTHSRKKGGGFGFMPEQEVVSQVGHKVVSKIPES